MKEEGFDAPHAAIHAEEFLCVADRPLRPVASPQMRPKLVSAYAQERFRQIAVRR
jgi:hypothetical protein